MANVTQFLERVTKQALEAREKGDTATLNAITADAAIRDYVNNVVFLGTMTPSQFEYWHKDKYARIGQIAEQYEKQVEERQRVDSIEARLDKMTKMLEALVEVQTAKQKAAVVAAVEDTDEQTGDEEDEQKKPDEADEEAETPPATDAAEDEPEDEAE